MLRIEDISYRAGRIKILDALSCDILPGELTVLLGANGAGKSTLLRLISGERSPHAGKIWWGDRQLHSFAPAELARWRAVLTQHTVVSLPFTVEEIVLMGRYPHYRNSSSEKDRAIVAFCLEEMKVRHLAARYFYTLSGGEQQRVHMARVLAQLRGREMDEDRMPGNSPGLLLLDEPTSSLDWQHQQLCLQKARELAISGYTVVVVLHDLNLAAQFADRILLLKNGRLLTAGEPGSVLIPEFIQAAYGINVTVFYPEGSPFPVVIPTTIKNEIYANN
ncbi:MAG: heme ABC transporter ATP-binding protein [Chitinophagaceae bacterium]|nr:heme ABC transporter ATP-binding protein [Chitinophagaceae bacterium]